jgi:glycosyltransferase involved in cell wall biosynthesis
MSDPLVSIIIPTYFRNEVLVEAIRSANSQTYKNTEILIVDDSGTGHAESVIPSSVDCNYIKLQRNRGANNARKIGLTQANGELVQFLDDDDLLKKKKLEMQVEKLLQRDEVGVVYSGIKTSDGVTNPDPAFKGDVLSQALQFEMSTCMNSTMLIESEYINKHISLKDRGGGDDFNLVIDLAQQTEFDFISQPLVVSRNPSGSRGFSRETVAARHEIIRARSNLYDKFDKTVEQTAKANTYQFEAQVILSNQSWSYAAIRSYCYMAYFSTNKFKPILILLASFFGRPGIKSANKFGNFLKRIRL